MSTDIKIDHDPEHNTVVMEYGPALWLVCKLLNERHEELQDFLSVRMPGCPCRNCSDARAEINLITAMFPSLERVEQQHNANRDTKADQSRAADMVSDLLAAVKKP